MCLSIWTELANKLQEEQEEMKCSVDLDAQPRISSDPDEAQGGDSPPDGTLDCHSPNHTATDYITWNGTHSMVHKRSLKVSFKWSVSLSPLQGQGQKRTVMYKWGPKTPDVTLLWILFGVRGTSQWQHRLWSSGDSYCRGCFYTHPNIYKRAHLFSVIA